MREVELWVGKTDDAKVPPRVRIRIFEREGGRCWISGRKITPADVWELDHKIALCNGGRHAEDNLAPAIKSKHREKTDADLKTKSHIAAMKAKHLGIKKRSTLSHPTKVRGFDGVVRERAR